MNKWLLTLTLWLSTGAVVFGANTTARLALAADTVRPGDTVLAGVVLKMNSGWHTYWRNPGESGMASEIEWTLPDGVKAGPIQWPTPDYYDTDGLVTYVLHDQAVLLVFLTFSADLAPGPLTLQAEVSWLECEVQCVPGNAKVQATINIGSETTPSKDASLITRAKQELPVEDPSLDVSVTWDGTATGHERALVIEWSAPSETGPANFFAYAAENFEVWPQTQQLPANAGRRALRATVKLFKGEWPAEIRGVLTQQHGSTREAYLIQQTISEADIPTGNFSSGPGNQEPDEARHGLAFYLLLALGGGLILNLMPCVLPILSLKVLSLVRQGGSSAGERREHGLVYTLGVLVSFWAISALVIAGRLASWGEQFQDPRFIVAVTVLMTLVALNLFGVFEVVLPGSTVSSATQLASREGAGGAFFNGVLAVVLGASCVAPLLAAAIGWAISQPPLYIFLTFTLIGLGLALPFLLLSFFPALQKLLPRPGPWMEHFKIAMGFPMLATAVWLLSQTVTHFGSAGPLWIGLFLILLALSLWIYGVFVQRGTRHKALATILALLVACGGYTWTLEDRLDWRSLPDYSDTPGSQGGAAWPHGVPWQSWSVAAVEEARANGQPVLVDFTAEWCLTCNTIVKPALETETVAEKLKSMNAVALIADYTRKSPEILAGIREFQRAGVPLVVVYPASPEKPPRVLPDPNPLLGPAYYAGLVLQALDQSAE